jgi:hypothetical protein
VIQTYVVNFICQKVQICWPDSDYMDKDSAKSLYFVVSVHTDESKCQNTAFLLVDIRSNLDSLLCTHMMRKRVFLTWLLKLHTTVFFIILYPP